MRFGPMHYRDIAVFLGVGCREGGEYEYDQTDAVGQAFRTYIVPRLLNAAAFPDRTNCGTLPCDERRVRGVRSLPLLSSPNGNSNRNDARWAPTSNEHR